MTNILKFPVPTAKLGFSRAHKRGKPNAEETGQINLFSPVAKARIIEFPSKLSLFEQALYSDEHSDEHADALYRRAIEQGDEVADAYCNLGIIEYRKDRVSEAFDCFTRALTNDTRHLEAHYNLGNLYFDQGDLRLAKMHYEMAIAIDAAFPNVYFNLGLALAVNQEYSSAAEKLLRYIELVPHEDGEKVNELIVNLRRTSGQNG